ncbi:phospholipase A1-IIdelta-like [Cornus florida]|uniref:phospholipase A1-IIdelta-like n=1 Tax=Cornus florida TaxID=4283 RepID=UPI00289CE783|nr:phospholipase A1-IIdelta-like [Cornus florida]
MATEQTQPTWAELLGSNEWNGLLDPLDLSLRKLILSRGDMSQATYDAFINDPNSKYCGYEASDYQIVSFLYATATIDDDFFDAFIIRPKCPAVPLQRQSNWMGYVAVTADEVSKANGRCDIYVAWRGTVQPIELKEDLHIKLVPATPLMSGSGRNDNYDGGEDDVAKVMEGWLTICTQQPGLSISKNQRANSSSIDHHKIDGSVQARKLPVHVQVAAFLFGCPMLGNQVFCDKLKALQNLRILHVKNKQDIIPDLPSIIFGYAYAGIEFVVDSAKSPFLNHSLDNIINLHNLQGRLHVVAGWNGKEGEFELKVKRSLALVNKFSNFLKEKYQVPEYWWVEKNKGMVLDQDGDWVEARPQED